MHGSRMDNERKRLEREIDVGMVWQHQSHNYELELLKSPIRQVTYSSRVDEWMTFNLS